MADPYNFDERVEKIRQKDQKATVMFVGAPGAGKSSLINSLINIIHSTDHSSDSDEEMLDKYVPTAPADLMGGHTMMRESVELTDNLTIVDNRGWQEWGSEIALKELAAQINGERSLVDKVDWEQGGQVYKKASGMPLVVAEKITSIAVVINGKGGVDALHDFKELIKICTSDTGRIPTVVVTHRDQLSIEEIEHVQSILKQVYGISSTRVFTIHNMTGNDTSVDDYSKYRLLDFLDCCIRDATKASKFHDDREQLMGMIIQNEKELEAQERIKEAENAQREAELAKRELETAIQEVDIVKALHEKLSIERETKKQDKLAEIATEMKEDERKHTMTMNKEKEETYAKTQQVLYENKAAEDNIKLENLRQREKMLLQFEEETKKDELKAKRAADDKAKEQNTIEIEKQKSIAKFEDASRKEELRHQEDMNRRREENWMKLNEDALGKFLEAEKHANEVDSREKRKYLEGIFRFDPK